MEEQKEINEFKKKNEENILKFIQNNDLQEKVEFYNCGGVKLSSDRSFLPLYFDRLKKYSVPGLKDLQLWDKEQINQNLKFGDGNLSYFFFFFFYNLIFLIFIFF